MGKLPEVIIKYKGIFDFDTFFKTVYGWLIYQGFEVEEGKYKHKIPNPKGAEQEIGWSASRQVNAYLQYNLKIEFKLWDLKDVEIVKENEKKKMAFAKLRIYLNAAVETDYSKRFTGSKFLVGLKDFFEKFIYRQDINDVYEDQLYYRVYKLHRIIKEHLDMECKTNAFEGRW